MTETKRTAAKIRAYCEAARGCTVGRAHDRFMVHANEDMRRVLEAATYRGHALRRILVHCDDSEIVRSWATHALADTAFLADAPAAVDGETTEEGES